MASINAVFKFQDRITRKLARPTRAIEKVAKTTERTNKMFRTLGRMRINPRVGLRDQATRKLRTISRTLNGIGSTVATATIKVKDNASKALTKVESRMDGLGSKVLGLGAVAGISGAGLFSAGSNAFETDSRAAAITNLDPSVVTKLADSIYYDKMMGNSRNDVVQALVNYSQQAKLEGKALREAVEGTAVFTQMYGTDINETVRGFASGLKNNLGTFDEIKDVSAFVMKNAGDQYDDYLDSINEYASTFKDLKLNISQVGAAYIAAVQAGGRNFDEPSDMFREFNIRRLEMTDNQITAMAKLFGKDKTKEIYKAMDAGTLSGQQVLFEYATALSKLPSEAQKAAYATELLGTKYEDLKEPMLAAARAISDPVQAVGEMDKQFGEFLSNNPMTEITKTTRELGKSLKNIGQSMIVAVTPAFQELNKWATSKEGKKSIAAFTKSISELSAVLANNLAYGIRYVIDNWEELLPYLKGAAQVIGGLFVLGKVGRVAKEAAPIFRFLGNTFKTVWSVGKWLTSGIISLGRGFMTVLNWAKPFIPWVVRVGGTLTRFIPVIGWVVTALTGLWLAWKNWDKIVSVVSGAWEGAKKAIGAGVDWIVTKVDGLMSYLSGLSVNIPVIGEVGVPDIVSSGVGSSSGASAVSRAASKIAKNANTVVTPFPNMMQKYVDGNHAKGISDVPFDNYTANLHKGETVLPAEEASLIRDMAGGRNSGRSAAGGNKSVQINFTGDNHYSNEMDAKKVVRIIKDALKNEFELGPSGVQLV